MIWKALIVGRIFWRLNLVICFDVSLLLLQVGLNVVYLCVCVSKGSVFGYECSTTCACVCECVCERERERESFYLCECCCSKWVCMCAVVVLTTSGEDSQHKTQDRTNSIISLQKSFAFRFLIKNFLLKQRNNYSLHM